MIQLAAGVAMAAKPARTLTAQRLVLTDVDGRQRIVMGVSPDGAPKMAMYDGDRRERADFAWPGTARPQSAFTIGADCAEC
jgi:hypothetical protein